MAAEWQVTDPVVVMALPHSSTDWAYMLDDAVDCFGRMAEAIIPYARILMLCPDSARASELMKDYVDAEIKTGRIMFHSVSTNDTWTRDYAPMTVVDDNGRPQLLDFTFNGWGMKFAACHDNCVNRALERDGLFSTPLENHKGIVLEGGSIDCDGAGHLLVTSECLLEPNRNPEMTRGQIDRRLCEMFGLRKVLWLDHGYLEGDDTDSHVDTLARFAPDSTIIYVGCDDPDDPHYPELHAMADQLAALRDSDGHPFRLVRLPMAPAVYEDGQRLPSTYANFLALPDAVIMPSYGHPETDDEAARLLEAAYSVPVVQVDCRALVRQHGSLHCSTMQIPLSAFDPDIFK